MVVIASQGSTRDGQLQSVDEGDAAGEPRHCVDDEMARTPRGRRCFVGDL